MGGDAGQHENTAKENQGFVEGKVSAVDRRRLMLPCPDTGGTPQGIPGDLKQCYASDSNTEANEPPIMRPDNIAPVTVAPEFIATPPAIWAWPCMLWEDCWGLLVASLADMRVTLKPKASFEVIK